jgi:hypothetical protein
MLRLPQTADKSKCVVWVEPIRDNWRFEKFTKGTDRYGYVYCRASGRFPVVSFPAAMVRAGDRIACFTVISNPVETSDETGFYFHADMLCDCGWVIPGLEIGPYLHCGHLLGMSPDHFWARTWKRNHAAYLVNESAAA